ncbi:zinc finger MYM-type protein 1-like [Aphis craccivora]|uniref:Zinc finger MYM-type protein 1-like n=1 Tax=Aphis craccivora TaxID=307492 RepID=A0A6G0WME1_APHCR|nr:zinc finger MYM-type protein 1-like [Aphis craccivora]
MSIFWGDILERFNACSKKLQSIQINSGIVVEIYQSLIGFVHDIQCDEMFNDYKTRAISNSEEYVFDDDFENFKINTYFIILNQINIIFLSFVKTNTCWRFSFSIECVHFQSHVNCSKKQKCVFPKKVLEIKTTTLSTMKEKRLNALSVLNIESEIKKQLDYKDIIKDFANKPSRKKL